MFNCFKRAYYTHVAQSQTSAQIANFARIYGSHRPFIEGAFDGWTVQDLFYSKTTNPELRHAQQVYAQQIYQVIKNKQAQLHRARVEANFDELINNLHDPFSIVTEVVPLHVPGEPGKYFALKDV